MSCDEGGDRPGHDAGLREGSEVRGVLGVGVLTLREQLVEERPAGAGERIGGVGLPGEYGAVDRGRLLRTELLDVRDLDLSTSGQAVTVAQSRLHRARHLGSWEALRS